MTTDRFSRTELLLGKESMARLKKAKVLVVGCGAVGGYALEALARSGIGALHIVDFDVIEPSNINRQILALNSTIGKSKAQVACERLKDINPNLKIQITQTLLNTDTIDEIFNQPYDFAIDAIDSLNPKVMLIAKLKEQKIPFISSMGAALKSDISLIETAPMSKTRNCPLACFIRKRLRRQNIPLDFPVVYSREDVSDKSHLAPSGENQTGTGRRRLKMGSLATITGMFGLICAHEAILFLTNHTNKFPLDIKKGK